MLILLMIGGCGDETSLTGSLSDVYSLAHTGVRARLYSSELAIEYVDTQGAVPVRITLRVNDVDLAPNQSYDLVQYGDVSGRRVDGTDIPRYETGTIHLGEYEAVDGAPCSGDFEAKFDTGRDVLGLAGDFSAALEIVLD